MSRVLEIKAGDRDVFVVVGEQTDVFEITAAERVGIPV